MRIEKISWICLLPLFILLSNDLSFSQVAVERSKEKVVISGVPYYIHTVRKGETAYSISKAYGITVGELLRENPSAQDGLREGENLRIEVSKVTDPHPAPLPQPYRHPVHDENRFIYHVLEQGETIYRLSVKYGVTEEEIIDSNPGIDISKIPIGSEIAIPRRDITEPSLQPIPQAPVPELKSLQKQVPETPGLTYHRVVRGETMFSIASKYGLTVRELRKLNKGVRFPQVGDYIIVPGEPEDIKEKVVEPEVPDSLALQADTIPVLLERPSTHTSVADLRGSFNVAVLLPFYLDENSRRYETDSLVFTDGKRSIRVFGRSERWIYPGSLPFLEMYEGILLAADTLNSLGLDINLYSYDIQSDTAGISRLIHSGTLNKMDLIIGPVHSANLAIVSRFASARNIPVVSPVPMIDNSLLVNNPFLFMAGSSLKVAQRAIAEKAASYDQHNIVVVFSDTLRGKNDLLNLRACIMAELSKKALQNQVNYNELMFYSRSAHGMDSIRRIINSLSEERGNVIIIASEEPPVMSETLMVIHSLIKKYDIKIFGYPYMRNLENLDPKYFFDLNLMVYSPYWINYSNEDVSKFNDDFRNIFYTQPAETSFAWLGYDIAYYFLSGLAIHGRKFIVHPEIHNPDLLQTEFDFRRESYNSGFENKKLFLVRFSDNYEVKLEDYTEFKSADRN